MAVAAGTLVGQLAVRVRDSGRGATSNDNMLLILSWAQRIVNARRESTIATGTLTTEPHRLLYPLYANFNDIVRVVSVRHNGRDLTAVPYVSLRQSKLSWFRDTADQFAVYALAGRDTLALYPARTVADTVTLRYVKLTTALTHDTTMTEVPDDELPDVLNIAELLLNLKMRQFGPVTEMLKGAAGAAQEGTRE